MAINPNTNFTAGATLTADQQNRFPRGVMALATSSTTYVLTTAFAIATGMTVTFTAVANRNYRITYYEPQVQTPNVAGFSLATINVTNAAGTQLQSSITQTAANTLNASLTVVYVGTFSAGSVTLVGCGLTSNTTGAPTFVRSATAPGQIIVEDIGPA